MSWPPERAFQTHRWQAEAVNAWEAADRRGVIEAVTGTGKTYAGLEAIDRLIRIERRLSTLIVVPTIVLLNQWRERLQGGWKPSQRVAQLGGGLKEDFSRTPIACVAVINSAITALPNLFEHVRRSPVAWRTLLIADECHRYLDAPEWGTLTSRWRFHYILGLTATMPRFGAEGLGRIVYEYTFQQAFADGLVPAFELIDAEVRLTVDEEKQYHRLDAEVREQRIAVWRMHGDELAQANPDRFIQALQAIMTRGAKSPSEHDPTIKRYLVLLYERAAIAYTARHKIELAEALIRVLGGGESRKVIVFFERIESAESVGEAVELDSAKALARTLSTTLSSRSGSGVEVLLYHSGLAPNARSKALGRFAASKSGVMLACRALDEGLDVPDVDAAILVSSTQSARQRIQRIGRVLRRGDGEKRPIVVSIHVRGTGDENVVAEDQRLFGSVANIHRTDGPDALKLVQSLCSIDPMAPPPRVDRHRVTPMQYPPLAPKVVRPPGV